MNASVHSTANWPKASIPKAVQDSWEKLVRAEPSLKDNVSELFPATAALAGNSTFLADLLSRHAQIFKAVHAYGPDAVFASVTDELITDAPAVTSLQEMQKTLRVARQKMALIIAMADLSGFWDVMTVTDHLTAFADTALDIATNFILKRALIKGDIKLEESQQLVEGSGLILLAMGKHGAHELNYSSDIDLILLFDAQRATYSDKVTPQSFYNQFAKQLISLLDERTKDGYVFRVDLRLRPDPRSTPLAVNLNSAVTYYETLGQNWERAAMIKARPVVADSVSLENWRSHIRPFIWRTHLDYAAVQDIQSIRRQISNKTGEAIDPAGFNIKLGTGGIREIELFVQSHQLIHGGRNPQLRLRGTLRCLQAMADEEMISAEDEKTLREAYLFYRHVEHRLQMVADQQTHSLPEHEEERLKVAIFSGFQTLKHFETTLQAHLRNVHAIYTAGMEPDASLSGVGGNLVFTGVDADPETLKTLTQLGFSDPTMVSNTIQDWHRGTRRATKTLRARQILTELTPALLEALSCTQAPDDTFRRLDQFISGLPAGVQLFSLFMNQHDVMRLVVTILGVAPDLGETLSKHPALLDGVMSDVFYEPLPDRATLDVMLEERLLSQYDIEDDEKWLRVLRQFKQECGFQAGVQLISGDTDVESCNRFLSDLADCLIQHILVGLKKRFSERCGVIDGGEISVIAMGRLGAQELTFHSDVDIMLVYNAPIDSLVSDGEKPLDTNTWYQRFASRFFTALTMLTKEGRLYDVDNRLRPYGIKGPLAISMAGFHAYYRESAWTVEIAGLCKARVIACDGDSLRQMLDADIGELLRNPSPPKRLAQEMVNIREKMHQQNKVQTFRDVKHTQGGLIDLDFMAHYLTMRHGYANETLVNRHSIKVFDASQWVYVLPENDAQILMQAYRVQRDLLSVLRLCDRDVARGLPDSTGLRRFLITHFETDDLYALDERIQQLQQDVCEIWQRVMLQSD